MSCSKWRYTEQCEGRPCPGDCDECSFDPDEYTVDESTVSYGGKNGEMYHMDDDTTVTFVRRAELMLTI